VARTQTIKCGEVECLGSNLNPCINYAMSLSTELSSHGLSLIFLLMVEIIIVSLKEKNYFF